MKTLFFPQSASESCPVAAIRSRVLVCSYDDYRRTDNRVNSPTDNIFGKHTNMSTFGQRLKSARKTAKLSQTKLGETVGLSQSVISDLESGAQNETALVVQLAVACGVDPVWLAINRGEPKPVALEIAAIWNELDHDRKLRLLGTAYDILVGQRGSAIRPSELQPFLSAPMPSAPAVKLKKQKI